MGWHKRCLNIIKDGQTEDGNRVFLSGTGGPGKSYNTTCFEQHLF